jgi:RNA polymerase sigma factor (TIGR02999 family)
LQPTALVHEAWMKLHKERGAALQGKTHGLALAAQAMRRVLIDHGRHQKRDKRGGRLQHVTIDDLLKGSTAEIPVEDLLTLEAALERLESEDPRAAEVVVLRFYSGLSNPEVAQHLGLSLRTVESDWTHARVWLKRELSEASK